MRNALFPGLVCWLAASALGHAASVKVIDGKAGKPSVIMIEGELELGDEQEFIETVLKVRNGFVVLNSKGGNLVAGIKMGQAIRIKEFVTIVPDNALCASACALAWLGGQVRFMAPTAKVGFHTAFVKEGKKQTVSGTANALIGAYLNSLGLSGRAVIFISEAPPEGMSWLSLENAERYGIAVRRLELKPQVAATSPPLAKTRTAVAPASPEALPTKTALPASDAATASPSEAWHRYLEPDQEFTLRIVSRPNEPAGVWRVPASNPNARNYYLIVEPVAPDGQVLTLPLTSEEDGQTAHVSRWGMRVTEDVFNQVRQDLQDDGIVQKNRLGEKRLGQSHIEFAVPVLGGAISKW